MLTKWSTEEKQVLIDNWMSKTAKKIQVLLKEKGYDRTTNAIELQGNYKLNLNKRPRWNEKEETNLIRGKTNKIQRTEIAKRVKKCLMKKKLFKRSKQK